MSRLLKQLDTEGSDLRVLSSEGFEIGLTAVPIIR